MVRKFVTELEEIFLSLLLVSMTLLVFAEVVLRFGFNTGIHWAQEATLLIAAWFVLYGASYGIKAGVHIGVDVFVKLLPSKIHRVLTILALGLCLTYAGLLLYGSWIYLSKMKMIGIELEDIPIPKWTVMSILIIGFVMLIIRLLQLGLKIVKGEADGFHFTDEAEESMEIAKELQAEQNRITSEGHDQDQDKNKEGRS